MSKLPCGRSRKNDRAQRFGANGNGAAGVACSPSIGVSSGES